jgi:predicted nuclease with RNAse H fold
VTWIGVDVGGERKGFDMAVINRSELLSLRQRLTWSEAARIVEDVKPLVVGIDSPCCCAARGETSRECERMVAREVCGIRWTPDASAVQASDYYGWIVEGLRLYAALESARAEVIEVFPTASWTRWLGKRGSESRSAWSRRGLTGLGLTSVPERTNQDQRDAIAAAITARQYSDGATQSFGEIVVPAARVSLGR